MPPQNTQFDKGMLQAFLDNGLLSIESDEDFEKLTKAADALAQKFTESKVNIITSVLVALDPNISSSEPILVETEEVVKGYWTTFRTRFRNGASSILRGIILDALHKASINSTEIAAIIWLTGSNYLPYADLDKEYDVCSSFINSVGKVAEKESVKRWAVPSEIEIPPISNITIEEQTLKLGGIDSESLEKGLTAAVGPNEVKGVNSYNQYSPNQPQNWGPQFAELAAEAIAEAIQPALNNIGSLIGKQPDGVDSALNKFAHSARQAIRAALLNSVQRMTVQEYRLSLLWWIFTRYSPTLQTSYRNLQPATRLVLMAYDLHNQVTDYTPQSIEYLLRELLQEFSPNHMSLADFLTELNADSSFPEFSKFLPQEVAKPGRISLLAYVGGLSAGKFSIAEFRERIGVREDKKIASEQLSVWLFRDMQAWRLVSL